MKIRRHPQHRPLPLIELRVFVLVQVIMDTDEVVAHPVLGPLTAGLLSRVSSALDPAESIFPITRLPGAGAGSYNLGLWTLRGGGG